MPTNSNYTINKRCPETVSTDCISWQGVDIECLGICTGDNLTEVQTAVATKVCELAEIVDVTSITLPECFIDAWGSQDKNILNFLVFILGQECASQKAIAELNNSLSKLDPESTVDYKCCDDTCISGSTLPLSQHLQKIILCICDLKSTVDSQASTISDLNDDIVSLTTTVTNLATQVSNVIISQSTLSSTLNSHKTAINCIISDLDDNSLNTNGCTSV